jgi:hypothetical protein
MAEEAELDMKEHAGKMTSQAIYISPSASTTSIFLKNVGRLSSPFSGGEMAGRPSHLRRSRRCRTRPQRQARRRKTRRPSHLCPVAAQLRRWERRGAVAGIHSGCPLMLLHMDLGNTRSFLLWLF